MSSKQRILTLDVEGVLMPEVWVELAKLTGIDDLRRTTRDEPDYNKLMGFRLAVLARNGLKMDTVAEVLSEIEPLEGARDFLDALRQRFQVLLLSDTFEQFGAAMMGHLGMPTLFCHRLILQKGAIVDYQLRIDDHKRRTVEALKALNFHVTAGGDSFNDLTMLRAADSGYLFRAPSAIRGANSDLASGDDFDEFFDWILTQPVRAD